MKLDQYKMKRDRIVDMYRQLIDIAEPLDMQNLVGELNKNIRDMDEEIFNLVVVGEFSRGKSTFVNALLGQRILPSSKRPTTAVISKIAYNDNAQFRIHYKQKEKTPKEVSAEEFKDLVAPSEAGIIDKVKNAFAREKQKKLDSISYVEIGYPLEFCRDNVNVVDTPGTNDLNVGRIEITYQYVEKADAVILVMAANQALTASELSFLEERIIGNQIKDIFFVVNYKDALNGPQEEANVKRYIEENLRQKLSYSPESFKLYMVSSLQALLYKRSTVNKETLTPKQMLRLPDNFEDTGFRELEDALWGFLSEEKGNAKLKKYVSRGNKAIKCIYDDINMRLDMSERSVEEIQEKYTKLEPAFQDTKKKVSQLVRMLRERLENGSCSIVDKCVVASNAIRSAANRSVDNYSGDVNEEDIRDSIEGAVYREQKRFIGEMTAMQKNLFDREIALVNNEVQKIWTDISLDYHDGKVSGFDFAVKFDVDMDIQTEMSSTSVHEVEGALAGAVMGAAVAGPVGAIIGGIFGAVFGGSSGSSPVNVKKQIKYSINTNFKSNLDDMQNSVLHQYRRNIDRVCNEIERNFNSRLDDMDRQLKSVLAQKQATEQDAGKLKQDLENKRNEIKLLFAEFSRMYNDASTSSI